MHVVSIRTYVHFFIAGRSRFVRRGTVGMKNTVATFQEMKQKGEKISMLTCYDYSTAKLMDEAGVNSLLIGDSLGNVILGYEDTLSVTMEDMIHHTAPVARGAKNALVIADMPFMSYQASVYDAVTNAGRLMKEGRANAVKLEGGEEVLESVGRILSAGIPVMGHLGLTPQSIHKFGTYVVRAQEDAEAKKLIEDAHLLEEAGCFAIVLEKIPAKLAAQVAKELTIPIIGIGAGGGVDGQVLVIHDMLGINQEFSPRFLRRYHNLYAEITGAVGNYINDVKSGNFPNEREQY